MDIVNKSLPRGNKFVPVPKEHLPMFNMLFNRKNIEDIQKVDQIITDSKARSDYWHLTTRLHMWKIEEGSDEWPKITMPPYALSNLNHLFGTFNDHSKSRYAGALRIGVLDLPVARGANETITLRWDPVRGGLVVFDIEYEGELVNNKPMVINKKLKELTRQAVSEVALRALLDADDSELEIPYAVRSENKAARSEILIEVIEKISNGTYDTVDLVKASYILGIHGTRYVTGIGYVLNTDDFRASSQFDITSSARTKLIYLFGGYTLPDNYQDWFDG